jgi:hypothetical protein
VRHAPHDKKVEFLRSKGIDEAEIHALLGQEDSATETEVCTYLYCRATGSNVHSLLPTQKLPAHLLQRLPKLSPQRQPLNRPSTVLQS